jgi:hypothetical protein
MASVKITCLTGLHSSARYVFPTLSDNKESLKRDTFYCRYIISFAQELFICSEKFFFLQKYEWRLRICISDKHLVGPMCLLRWHRGDIRNVLYITCIRDSTTCARDSYYVRTRWLKSTHAIGPTLFNNYMRT